MNPGELFAGKCAGGKTLTGDGVQLIPAVKIREGATSGDKHIPIIALTADAVPSTRKQIQDANMDAYLLKPIDEQQIWLTIENVLNQSPLGHIRCFPERQKIAIKSSDGLPARDMEKALSITGGDRRLAEEMLEQLKHELPSLLDSIKSAYDARNWEDLRDITHKLHGSTSSCGVVALDYAVQLLDSTLRETPNPDVQDHITAIETEIDRLFY